LHIALSLAVSALAAALFLPAVRRLLARGIPADILKSLMLFAVLAVLIAGLFGGGFSRDLHRGFEVGVWDWANLLAESYKSVLDKLSTVAQVLACIFVVAIFVYVNSPKPAEGGDAA
jgi:hypothetical protein